MIKNKNTSIDKYMDYSRIINIFKIHLEKYKYARIILEKNKYNKKYSGIIHIKKFCRILNISFL